MTPRYYRAEDIREGQSYRATKTKSTCDIIEFKNDYYTIILNGYGITQQHRLSGEMVALMLGDTSIWALTVDNHCPIINKINACQHTNIREDRFFSAAVYKTCKDCGATLN